MIVVRYVDAKFKIRREFLSIICSFLILNTYTFVKKFFKKVGLHIHSGSDLASVLSIQSFPDISTKRSKLKPHTRRSK